MQRPKTGTVRGFPDRLDKLIYDRGIDCTELAKRIGVDRRTIYRYRNGEATPNLVIFSRICTVLQTTPNYLLLGKE